MMFELGTFPVREVRSSDRTRWADGVLEINERSIVEAARVDPKVTFASVEAVRPGESARIVNVADVLQPLWKVSGDGVAYPAICGRPSTAVGRGRTHCLGDLAVVECTPPLTDLIPHRALERDMGGRPARRQDFIDMSGPGAVRPFARIIDLVLALETVDGLDIQDRYLATRGATLRVIDHLGRALADQAPPLLEAFDDERHTGLPRMALVPILASAELRFGADAVVGNAIYGLTRLSAPWILRPSELLDGAISQGSGTSAGLTWELVSNPAVLDLMRRHGKDIDLLAVLVHRSNWGRERDSEIAAQRVAEAATMLGVDAAIVASNLRGGRFVDTVAVIRACEQAGIKTVLIAEEEDVEGGSATPLLINDPAIAAAVSTGTGAVPHAFPPVARVVGARSPDADWYGELPPIPGRYGALHVRDLYGAGRQSCASY